MKKKSVVNSQMSGGFPSPSMSGASGIYDRGKPPFDKPRSMGKNTPATKFYDTTVSSKTPTPTQTAGMDSRAPRPGTKQRPYGKSNT